MIYIRERVKHVIRFRHKRGYGVHSPFMFTLITRVIRDRKKRYVYPEGAEKKQGITRGERKLYRLVFRLAVYLNVRNILIFAKHPEGILAYLSEIIGTDVKVNVTDYQEKTDIIYIAAHSSVEPNRKAFVKNETNQRKCVVIEGIHLKNGNHDLWRTLRKESTVSIDMMWYGILFFDDKLQQGKYNLII